MSHPRRCQALIGVVGPQAQAVFGAGGEHPVGLADAPRDEVVNHHADVRICPAEDRRLDIQRPRGRVQAGDKALRRGLLVTRRPVDLPRQEQPRQSLHLERRAQRPRVDVIVLDRVAGLENPNPLEAPDRPDIAFLDVGGQRGRDPIGINGRIVHAFGLEEDLMRLLFGKPHHLVFDRRAIPRADAFDLAAVHGGAMEIFANDCVGFAVGMRDSAGNLRRGDRGRQKREQHGLLVAGLPLQLVPGDGAPVKARRRSCLQSAQIDAEVEKTCRQAIGRSLTHAAAAEASRSRYGSCRGGTCRSSARRRRSRREIRRPAPRRRPCRRAPRGRPPRRR